MYACIGCSCLHAKVESLKQRILCVTPISIFCSFISRKKKCALTKGKYGLGMNFQCILLLLHTVRIISTLKFNVQFNI